MQGQHWAGIKWNDTLGRIVAWKSAAKTEQSSRQTRLTSFRVEARGPLLVSIQRERQTVIRQPLPTKLNESSHDSGAVRAASIVRRLLSRSFTRFLLSCLALLLPTTSVSADGWFDTFCQYRIPFETNSKHDGWVRISLTTEQITNAINRVSRFQFDATFFAFNAVTLVEVDETGKVVNAHPEAGFYLTRVGSEQAKGWQQATGDMHAIRVVKNKPHLLEFVSSDFGKNPAYKYETIFLPGSSMRSTDYRTSFSRRCCRTAKLGGRLCSFPIAKTCSLW